MARYIDAEPIVRCLKSKIINPQTDFINTVLIGLLNKAPAADVAEVKHGEWIGVADYGNGNCIAYCSVCGVTHKVENPTALKMFYKYCRWCGAKMDGEGKVDNGN